MANPTVESHPDFPEFFRQAREEVFGEFSPRIEEALVSGNTRAFERLDSEIDRQARQRAVTATRAMLDFNSGRGGSLLYSQPFPAPQTLTGAPVASSPPMRSGTDLATQWVPAPGASAPTRRPTLDELSAPPSTFDQPGYRPTSGIALGPQSRQEGQDLAAEARGADAFMNITGVGPLRRAGLHLSEGDLTRGAAGIGEAALMTAFPFTRLGRAAFTTLPRAIGTGLGMGVVSETAAGRGLAPSSVEAQAPSEAVKQLQRQLQEAGHYSGPIDGIMGRGTRDAKAAFDAAQSAASTTEIERIRAQAAATKAKAEETAAATSATESARKAADRAAGDKRLRELDGSWLSQGLNAAMTYGPWAGLGLGGWIGHRMQRALTGRATSAAATRADAADAIMAQPVAGTDVPGRIGRLNRFWSEGHPSLAEPFRSATTRAGRYPYTPNPNVPTAAELYQPRQFSRTLEGTPVPVVGGLEHISAELGLARPARQELAAAQKAVDADPSEANIQRLQLARARMAASDLTSRIGWGIGVGSGTRSIGHAIGGAPRARPASIAAAERERGLLMRLLTGQGGGGGRGPRRPSGGGGGGDPVSDPRLGGSGYRDPLTGRIVGRP